MKPPICDKKEGCNAPILEGDRFFSYVDENGEKHYLHDAPDRECRRYMQPPLNPAKMREVEGGTYHIQ